jgi:hypothetical protein
LAPAGSAASTTLPGQHPVLSNRAIGWSAIVLITVGVALAIFLLIVFGDGKHTDQLDAIKTAGTIVIGTGGAAALWLTARRQRATEIALNQAKDAHDLQEQVAAHTRANQDRVATATEADATARRITDLYTKAVDQLGSDKAPVRLGGLYALERLAQNNPDQRQTIVNVLCAYLRMPYRLPLDQAPADDAPEPEHTRFETRTQERQVRLTAQRILANHLRPGNHPRPLNTFWPDIDLDLTGASLLDLDFAKCCINTAQFTQATFTGDTTFELAACTGDARFHSAMFTGRIRFSEATFTGTADFTQATFAQGVHFGGTVFASAAVFGGATFGKPGFNYNGIVLRPSWVRLDVLPFVGRREWPEGWTAEPVTERPHEHATGDWGQLRHRPDPEPPSRPPRR